MLDKYTKIINEIKDQTLSIIDDNIFVMGKYFTKIKFETDDNLPYNQKTNVKVCVISLSCVFKKRNWYYPQIKLQECLYGSDYFDEN